jgi:predicted phosphohydrolase
MKAAEAVPDFAWLGQRPGFKILVKGNHDYWWPGSHAKMAQLLPPRTFALKKNACRIHGVGFFGARGGDFAPLKRYGDKRSHDDIEAWLVREEEELKASIAHLDQLDQAACSVRGLRICLFHYPPIPPGRTRSRFTPLIAEAGATLCVYGHLHGKEVGPARVEGLHDGVTYHCASCDLLDFAPRRIAEVPDIPSHSMI